MRTKPPKLYQNISEGSDDSSDETEQITKRSINEIDNSTITTVPDRNRKDSIYETSSVSFEFDRGRGYSFSRPVKIAASLILVVLISLVIAACVVIIVNPNASITYIGIHTEDINKTSSSPPVTKSTIQHFIQRFDGTNINVMNDWQVKRFETIVAGYINYYGNDNTTSDDEISSITTTCKIHDQNLHTTKPNRLLEMGQHRDRNATTYLEVDYTMIYISLSPEVTTDIYPAKFYKFMTSDDGKRDIKKDMIEQILVKIDGVDDLQIATVNFEDDTTNTVPMTTTAPSANPTMRPTPSPTISPTKMPTHSPVVAGETYYPSVTRTVVPTAVPSDGPTVVPTEIPSTVPSLMPSSERKDNYEQCFILFGWRICI